MILFRILLLPFTILYGSVIFIRNLLYQTGIFSRTEFDIPIICVGNLAAGGTGKTPHIEWIVRFLQNNYQLAVLSRGYKRKTTGYQFADEYTNASLIGDEPYQIHHKFPQIAVGVAENRVFGIPELLGDAPNTQVILMDDGYQHLALKADSYILLTDFNNLYTSDWLIPSGLLREFKSGAKRASIIIVTKCPEDLSSAQKEQIRQAINPQKNQLLLFSYIAYGDPVALNTNKPLDKQSAVIAFSGIANPKSFEKFMESTFNEYQHIRFKDHQEYGNSELDKINTVMSHDQRSDKVLVCTEKDAVKFNNEMMSYLHQVPMYYYPITIKFHDKGEVILGDYLLNVISSKPE